MSTESKFFIGIGAVTLILIIAGVFFLGKGNAKPKAETNFDTAKLTEKATHTKGNPQSSFIIVEFADIQCPACRAAQPIMDKVIEANKEKVYFVFRHYPLSIHQNSKLAAQAAEAAGAQGKFFEMIDLEYDKQADWSEKSNPREIYRQYAKDLGLDLNKFNDDMEKLKTHIEEDYALGNRAGVQSTPTFFINGKIRPGVIQETELQQLIDGKTQANPESTSTSKTPGQ